MLVVGDHIQLSGGNANIVIAFDEVDLGGGNITELHCTVATDVTIAGGTVDKTQYHTAEDLAKLAAEKLGLTL